MDDGEGLHEKRDVEYQGRGTSGESGACYLYQGGVYRGRADTRGNQGHAIYIGEGYIEVEPTRGGIRGMLSISGRGISR